MVGLPPLASVSARSGEEVTIVGRVCCEGEGKLNPQSAFLEGSRRTSNAVRVRLERAVGLRAGDKDGRSDPYAVLHLGGRSEKSAVAPKTVDPVWAWDFLFAFDDVGAPETPNYNCSHEDKVQHIRQGPPIDDRVRCWQDQRVPSVLHP